MDKGDSFKIAIGPQTSEERSYLIRKGLLVEDNDGEFRELSTVIYESADEDSFLFRNKSYDIPFVGVENVEDLQKQSANEFDDKENLKPPVNTVEQIEKEVVFHKPMDSCRIGEIISSGIKALYLQEATEKLEHYDANLGGDDIEIERLCSEEVIEEKEETHFTHLTTRGEIVVSQNINGNGNSYLNITMGTERLFSQEQHEIKEHFNFNVTSGSDTVNPQEIFEDEDYANLKVISGVEKSYSEVENVVNFNATTGFEIPISQDASEEEDYTNLNVTTEVEILCSHNNESEDRTDLNVSAQLDVVKEEEAVVETDTSWSEINNRSCTIATHEDDSYESSLLDNSCSTGDMDDTMSAIEKLLALAEEEESNEQANLLARSQTPKAYYTKGNKENVLTGSAKSHTPQKKHILSSQKKYRTLDSPEVPSFAKTPVSHYSATSNKGSFSASSVKLGQAPKSEEDKSTRKTVGGPEKIGSPNLMSLSAKTPELFFASEKNGNLSVYSVKKFQTVKSREATPIRMGTSPFTAKTPEPISAKSNKGSASASSVKRLHILKSREATPTRKSSGKLNEESPKMPLSKTSPQLFFTHEKNGDIAVYSDTHLETPKSGESKSMKTASDNLVHFSPYKPKRILDLKRKGKLFYPSPPRPTPNANPPRAIQLLVQQQKGLPDPAALCQNMMFKFSKKPTSPTEKMSMNSKMYADVFSPVREYIYGRATPSKVMNAKNRNVGVVQPVPLKLTESSFMASTPRKNLVDAAGGEAEKEFLSVGERVVTDGQVKEPVSTPVIPKLASGMNKFKVIEFKGSSKQRIETHDPTLLTRRNNEMALRHTGLRNESGNESLLCGNPLKKQFYPSHLTTPAKMTNVKY